MKFKSFIFATLFTITGAILGACGSVESHATHSSNFKMYKEIEEGSMELHYLIDETTGVNYIVLDRYKGGVAITPRLNANGTLYISE